MVRALRETEGIFCMDTAIQEALALHSFANTVMKYVEEDFCKGGDPCITHVSNEVLAGL